MEGNKKISVPLLIFLLVFGLFMSYIIVDLSANLITNVIGKDYKTMYNDQKQLVTELNSSLTVYKNNLRKERELNELDKNLTVKYNNKNNQLENNFTNLENNITFDLNYTVEEFELIIDTDYNTTSYLKNEINNTISTTKKEATTGDKNITSSHFVKNKVLNKRDKELVNGTGNSKKKKHINTITRKGKKITVSHNRAHSRNVKHDITCAELHHKIKHNELRIINRKKEQQLIVNSISVINDAYNITLNLTKE